MLHWQPGRQGGTYEKFTLFAGLPWLRCDLYLIRYCVGDYVTEHMDPIERGRHWRLNVELKRAKVGGQFATADGTHWRWWRFVFFRPDVEEHRVLPVLKGERLVLSFGWGVGK
jgi:hypothetical protein